MDALKSRALSVLPLGMTWPIHSELMRPVADAIAPLVAGLRTIRDPKTPYYGPEGLPANGEDVRRLLGTAFCFPTLWKDTFERLVADGARAFLEVGPGEMLTKMARWIDRTARCQPAGTLPGVRAAVDIVGAR
jgi:malonyl CoA-acyl carrier protein transacylase